MKEEQNGIPFTFHVGVTIGIIKKMEKKYPGEEKKNFLQCIHKEAVFQISK